jgi:hypothetical protein
MSDPAFGWLRSWKIKFRLYLTTLSIGQAIERNEKMIVEIPELETESQPRHSAQLQENTAP